MNENVGVDAGLKAALFFLVVFALLGYSAALSVFMGVIGGLLWGMIIYWLKGTFAEPLPPEEKKEDRSLISRARQRLSQLSEWRKEDEEKQKDESPVWFRGVFRPRRRRFRSRRR